MSRITGSSLPIWRSKKCSCEWLQRADRADLKWVDPALASHLQVLNVGGPLAWFHQKSLLLRLFLLYLRSFLLYKHFREFPLPFQFNFPSNYNRYHLLNPWNRHSSMLSPKQVLPHWILITTLCWLWLFLFYGWKTWRLGRWSDLPKVTQLVSGRFQSTAAWVPIPCFSHLDKLSSEFG